MPGTDELTADILENYIHQYNAFLLANHGVVTVGETLIRALFHMETVEHFAQDFPCGASTWNRKRISTRPRATAHRFA
jgi:hypothetical protein